MNSNKSIVSLLKMGLLGILIFAITACEKDNDPEYGKLLLGTWVNTMVNEQPILTDASFTMEFKTDNTELYGIGFQFDENNKGWRESNNYTYSVEGNLVTIDGVDVQGDSYHIVFKILSVNDKILTFTSPTFVVNGEAIPDTNTYTCEKITKDLRAEFTGVWYGRCTTEGSVDNKFHYWEYFSDGTFDYYYQDHHDNWIKKSDNEGGYFLYGHFFVSNYSQDLLTGGEGSTFECWNFTISGNSMVWKGLRENNVTITFEMEKVPSPPETIQ